MTTTKFTVVSPRYHMNRPSPAVQFQAIYYGVFSDNRPELSLPYFPIIEQFVPLGKWRTQVDWLPRDGKCSLPGAFTNFFEFWPDPDGKHWTPRGGGNNSSGNASVSQLHGINFPGHFSAFPELYYPNDMGQKSDAVFAGMHFMHYYDATQNVTFLQESAYPYLRLVADFYESYVTFNASTGRWDVLNSCAMEGCGEQALPAGIASNNPPFDLGPARTLLRKMVAYSTVLGVDADRRNRWAELSTQLASFPTTIDPATGKTVLDQDDDPAGFPTVTNPGNARYPITFFAGIHPGDALSLSDDPALVQVARDTVDAINAINWWSPTNGLCMAWPPASRVSNDAAVTLAHFDAALNATLQPNLWPRIENRPTGGWGCPIEQAGSTLAINDLLMQGHEGFIRLFAAGWALDGAASFTTLRADGGFLVSARTTAGSGGVPSDVKITSLAGRNCSLALPRGWRGVAVDRVTPGGGRVPVPIQRTVKQATQLWEFATVTGDAYSVVNWPASAR